MSPRFTQNAQGGGESVLIPVTPRRDRISSATVPGRRRGTVALVTSALREEERGLLIPLGLWARIWCDDTREEERCRRYVQALQGGGEEQLELGGPFWSCVRYDDTREEERHRRSSGRPEGGVAFRILMPRGLLRSPSGGSWSGSDPGRPVRGQKAGSAHCTSRDIRGTDGSVLLRLRKGPKGQRL